MREWLYLLTPSRGICVASAESVRYVDVMATDVTTTRIGTWRRLLRGQFRLGFLLLLVAIAPLLVWWLVPAPRFPDGIVSEAQIRRIKLGLNPDEVTKLLGKPGSTATFTVGYSFRRWEVWKYGVSAGDKDQGSFSITFSPGNGTVCGYERKSLALNEVLP